jgi:hypothetical protein
MKSYYSEGDDAGNVEDRESEKKGGIMKTLTFKDKAYLFYIRPQCVLRCKHSPLWL